jgi:hypothetical protein
MGKEYKVTSRARGLRNMFQIPTSHLAANTFAGLIYAKR